MDSNKLLIGFVAMVVLFLGFPIVANKVKASNAGTTTVAAAGTTQAAAGTAPASHPELNEPPLLNEQNLIGSEWQVNVEQYKIKVTIAAGGVAYATHPMAKALTGMDYVEGKWRVQHDKFFINASIGGNELAMELRIAGMKVYNVGKNGKISEVKRF